MLGLADAQLARRAGSYENAVAQRQFIYLFGAAAAETAADILLTPWYARWRNVSDPISEAVRIRLVSDPSYAKGMPSGFMRMLGEGGVRQLCPSPSRQRADRADAGFIPIVAKCVPTTQSPLIVQTSALSVAAPTGQR